jgi:16S rRNA (uracil1498-N3)-methyltransferase
VNIILFESDFFEDQRGEREGFLPAGDERDRHIRKVLKLKEGEDFKGGIFGGPVGTVRLEACRPEGMRLSFRKTGPPAAPHPLSLLVGYTRPISAKRILREAASLGAGRLVWTGTDTGERSYREAKLWSEGRYRGFLVDGLQQAGATVLPELLRADTLEDALRLVARPLQASLYVDEPPAPEVKPAGACPTPIRLLLDNEIGEERLAALDLTTAEQVIIAVGSERGWSDAERSLFLEARYRPVRLGARVLRTETACSAGAAVALGRMGLL